MAVNQQMISIIGPTATGKTGLALAVAQDQINADRYEGVDLISADSRQVYQGLSVMTGADVPAGFSQQPAQLWPEPFFATDDGKIALHGVSIIQPNQDWSVSHFQHLAQAVMTVSRDRGRFPLIVGGTGLYHRHLFNLDQRLHVGPNELIRTKADGMTLSQLQAWAERLDVARWTQLNHSDRHNPRRLIRLIELATTAQTTPNLKVSPTTTNQIFIGLTTALARIKQRIVARVVERFEQGAVAEVQALLRRPDLLNLPAASTLGVPEVQQFLTGELTQAACLQLWALHEFQYAKRQLTWWKNQPVRWFDVSTPDWLSQARLAVTDLVDQAGSD